MASQQLLMLFFRASIGFIFVFSFLNKIQNVPNFRNTITKFALFPSKYSNFLAYSFLGGELAVAVAMILGEPFLILGFALATLLFFAFSIGLSSVLIRNIQTSCGCFGPDENQVSIFHVIRSSGFMVCSILGFYLSFIGQGSRLTFSFLEWFLVGVMAIVFNVTWVNSGEVIKLFMRK